MSERTKLYFESFPSSFDDNRAVRHLSFLLGIPKRSSSVARIPGGRASRILKWYFESYCTSFSSLSHSTLTSPMPGGSSENHSGRLSRICEGYIDLSYLGLHAMVRSFSPASIKRQGAFLMGSVGTIAAGNVFALAANIIHTSTLWLLSHHTNILTMILMISDIVQGGSKTHEVWCHSGRMCTSRCTLHQHCNSSTEIHRALPHWKPMHRQAVTPGSKTFSSLLRISL